MGYDLAVLYKFPQLACERRLVSFFLLILGLVTGGFSSSGAVAFVDQEGKVLNVIGSLESNNGVVDLKWKNGEEGAKLPVILEQATHPDFSDAFVRYEGTDSGAYLTGLSEGDYFFRLKLSGGEEWSNPLAYTVKFIGRGQLFVLLAAGLIVSVMTFGAILKGMAEGREEAQS